MTDKDHKDSDPSASEQSGGDSEKLSKDEKLAFEKIISEIGQHEGDQASDAPPPETDSQSAEELDDDQQAALDKIMAEINGGDGDAAPEPEPETEAEADPPDPQASDELDDDQQAALDKIMAEINGGDGDAAPEPEPETEAEADPPDAKTSDELDDEQQVALDKIMAEINGGDGDATPEPEPETEAEADPPDPQASDELDDDQQAALDKIMAEINGGEGDDTADPASESKAADEPDAEQQGALDNSKPDGGNDASAKEPALEADEQTLDSQVDPDTSDADDVDDETGDSKEKETLSTETAQLSLEEFNEELNSLLETANANSESPAAEKAALPESDSEVDVAEKKDEASDDKSNHKPAEDSDPKPAEDSDQKPDEDSDAAEELAILHEVEPDQTPSDNHSHRKPQSKATKRRKPFKKIISYAAAALLVATIGYGGYWYFGLRGDQLSAKHRIPVTVPKAEDIPKQPIPSQVATIAPQPTATPITSKPQQSKSPAGNSANNALLSLKADIATARQQVLTKMEEVKELKTYYEKGISEDQTKIRRVLATNRVSTFKKALSHRQIGLSLRSIQRRQLYTTKLDVPIRQLTAASEELLFLERKTRMYETLNKGLSGLAIPEFTQEVSTIIGNLLKLSNDLSIDHIQMDAPSLELIWANVGSTKTRNSEPPVHIETAQDREISNDICRNNFDRKYLLKTLSVETAKCLAEWRGKDLYLNALTRLSPSQAKAIAQWPGEWLSLNGLKELSADAARQLSQWKGKRLSLNGLSHLSKSATQHLSDWNGEQLEMVGLESIGRWENYGTRLYLSEKLQRKLQVQ